MTNIADAAPTVRAYRADAPEDGETLLALIQGLADYERLEGPDADACARLVDDAAANPPRFEVRFAEVRDLPHDLLDLSRETVTVP